MLGLLVYLLVLALVIAVVWWVLGMLPLPPNVRSIVVVILSVIFLIWILYAVLPLAGPPARLPPP